MRKHGLTAAGLLLVTAVILLPVVAGGRAQANVGHSCSATDKQFISTAQVNLSSLNLWAGQYLQGDAKAGEVVAQARQAAAIVRKTEPRDPSLAKTRALLNSMFTEYARAIQAEAHHRDAGPHIYRAYGLANFAHDVLVQAKPALAARGWDIEPLL